MLLYIYVNNKINNIDFKCSYSMMNSLLTKVLLLFAFIFFTLYISKLIYKKLFNTILFYCFLCSIFSVLFKHHTVNKKNNLFFSSSLFICLYVCWYKQYKLK